MPRARLTPRDALQAEVLLESYSNPGEPVLWRVWFTDGLYVLRRAESMDAVYKSFKTKRRNEITSVHRVLKTSEAAEPLP